MFPSISPKQSFPALESEVLAYWKANNTFQKSIDSRPEDNPYRFYDGPPFITGTPHYGSLLSSVVKDVVGRYWTMRGKRVDRVWGWDCHGLPIEEKVQKKLGLSSNKEIEERGVKEFIDGCYEYTESTSAEWEWYIDKIGRWVDMDNAYRTMDQDYMESVMWVFSQLWEKGLIYEGKRVSLYSWKLSTPISNFEVAMDDTYQDVNDPAITVKFHPEIITTAAVVVKNKEGKILLLKRKSGNWTVPGGKIHAGETLQECCERELYEETGIRVSLEGLNPIHENYDIYNGKVFVCSIFEVEADISDSVVLEKDKFTEWGWYNLEDIKDGQLGAYDPVALDVFQGKRQQKFPLSILAWTTTPWTIPANMALGVGKDIDYVLVENSGEQFIVAKNRAEAVFKGKGDYAIVREFKGGDLVGLSYTPPFPEYYHAKTGDKTHKIYAADFATDTDGTGIVHLAPEFGDVDFQLAKKEGIPVTEAMDEAGKYTDEIFDYAGTHYLDANRINIDRMKENGTLFKNESITHRVPFCPRSGTPLVQKAQSSWFIDIQSQKEKLLEANKKINWFPEHLKFGRFAKGIESAPDWCISRTRFWGAPMPVWIGEDGEKLVVSSREEIYEMNKPYGQLIKLIITRHAESQANVEERYDNIGNSPLSNKGKQEAESFMLELKDKGVDIIITSPFLRAIQTAEPLAKELGIEIHTMNELVETNAGKYNNTNKTPETKKSFIETLFGDDQNAKVGETGESYNDIKSRMNTFISDICEKYPGKTIFVVTHGYQFEILRQILSGKTHFIYPNNASPLTFFVDVENKKQLNLHRPYIDSILLAPKNAQKPKKVLGIHGFKRTEAVVDFFEGTKKNLAKEGVQMDLLDFGIGLDTNYEKWSTVLDTAEKDYDTWVCHSLGCRVAKEYIIKNNIHLKKIILVAPNIGPSTEPALNTFVENLTGKYEDLGKYVEEIIVVSSRDDMGSRNQNARKVAELSHATFIDVNGYGHFNLHECKLIEDTIIGKPKPKKVLGIKGWNSAGLEKGNNGKWFPLKEKLASEGTLLDVPNFDSSKETSYAKWRETLESIELNTYDAIIAGSFGCPVIMQYLCEKKIKIPKLIMVAPSGLKGNPYIENIIHEMTEDVEQIRNLVGEIVIVHSKDDDSESARFEYGKELSEKLNCTFLDVNGYGHDFMGAGVDLLKGLITHGTPLTRVKEVLDVWMDSGSMPYAQMHYPFENKGEMEASFPADFIAEYVGQVRAWFYVMHVLGVLLNPNNESTPTPSFTNVITTGVINGNDGRKMSKSYGNYPDPRHTIEKYGADPIRFYMLNSPLLSGGDMDFKEEGIIETIKSVMLPLWNTYSFFTTYANIDTWERDNTEVWFTRHGETEHNTKQIMNGGDVDTPLNDTGREQAKQSGIDAKKRGISFDVIISSPLSRARETAQIMAEETGYIGEIIVHEGLLEQLSGKYAGKTIEEIGNEIGSQSVDDIRRAYKENNGVENIEEFEGRVIPAFKEILEKYTGKRILLVAHTGTFRPIKRYVTQTSKESAHYTPSIPHTELISIPTVPLTNPLDRWILSRLQVLIANVHDAMDGYDVSRACRSIVEYMDELTNWYVRLSRRRFWESGMTPDKESAYETLYTVLVEASKLLAPFMPFLAESIFQGLTKKESVHLEYITLPNRHLVDTNLNRDMQICEQIVSLGLALRSAKNIRVRQPLWSITVTKELDEYYQNIIRDELNVKQVRFENPEKLAKKICKPDARKIGPRFGKDVQYIITEAKNGNFIEGEDGKVEVGNFTLERGEYTIEYLPLENVGDIMGGYGMVVALDTTIDEDLKLEGYARDIIRLIQDLRKDANYNVTDRITLSLSGDGIEQVVTKFGHLITMETLSEFGEIASGDREKTESLDENLNITIKVKR